MAYYPDLSPYEYSDIKTGDLSETLNFGWLEQGHPFQTAKPEKWLVEKLWAHCLFAVTDYRGYHPCDLPHCNWDRWYASDTHPVPYVSEEDLDYYEHEGLSPHTDFPTVAHYRQARMMNKRTFERTLITVTRRGREEKLGYSEIRVFGENDIIYAAPNLVFHYVTAHHYKMPDEVIAALKHGPAPPEQEWFDRLRPTGVSMSFCQCMERVMRSPIKPPTGEECFAPPTGPVPWIPELRPRPVGAGPLTRRKR